MSNASWRWAYLAAATLEVVLGVSLAVVSISGFGLIDRASAGDVTVEEIESYGSLWRSILVGIVVVVHVEGFLRSRWLETWLRMRGTSRESWRSELVWRLQRQPESDRRHYAISSVLAGIGGVGIAAAVVVSLALDGEVPLRVSYAGKVIGGIGLAASSAVFMSLVWRNREDAAPKAS